MRINEATRRAPAFRKFSMKVSLYPHLPLLPLQCFPLTLPEGEGFLVNLVECHVSEVSVL